MLEALKADERLWELFTKKEEYEPQLLDQYQRFPYYLSGHRDFLEPQVSAFLMQNGLKVAYPDNKKFAVCLTHDIDSISFPLMTIASQVAQAVWQRQISESLKIVIGSSWKLLLSKISKSLNPARNFTQIMDLEKKYGAKSSFYFLALDKGNRDFSYRIEGLKKELRTIIDNGWEVGLHGGHEAYNNLDEIREEKERLENIIGKKVIGYRNHFMRFKVPTTWELLREAGFSYDATFGYADCVGFRNGMCHPFKPFNLNTNQYIDIWEIPLTIMDVTLGGYMQLDMPKAWEITKRLIDTVEKYNGVITILWHNTSIAGEMGKLYERILQYCSERHAWMTSGEEIWKQVAGNEQ